MNIKKATSYLITALLSLIVGILLILFVTSVQAGNLPYYTAGDPTMTIKYGMWPESDDPKNAGKTNAFTVELQDRDCFKYKVCYNPYFVHISNDAGKNSGFGFDIKYSMLKRAKDSFFITAGAVVFKDVLNDNDAQHTTSHIGAGVQIHHIVISLDAYSITEDVPSLLINAGVRF